jgi:hypothetical protein
MGTAGILRRGGTQELCLGRTSAGHIPSTATRAVQALEENLGSSLLARSQNRSA